MSPSTLLSLLSAGTCWTLLLSCLLRPLLLVGPCVLHHFAQVPCTLFPCRFFMSFRGKKEREEIISV